MDNGWMLQILAIFLAIMGGLVGILLIARILGIRLYRPREPGEMGWGTFIFLPVWIVVSTLVSPLLLAAMAQWHVPRPNLWFSVVVIWASGVLAFWLEFSASGKRKLQLALAATLVGSPLLLGLALVNWEHPQLAGMRGKEKVFYTAAPWLVAGMYVQVLWRCLRTRKETSERGPEVTSTTGRKTKAERGTRKSPQRPKRMRRQN